LRRKHGKTSVRVIEKYPNIPVAVVKYTFTHKKCTEQHHETEYTNGTHITIRINVHNNNNIYGISWF
jgi:hypothetical protein